MGWTICRALAHRCMSAGGAPTPLHEGMGWAKGAEALTQSGNRLKLVRRTTGTYARSQKTGPMCISRRLLEPYAHGAGLIVAAFSHGEHLAMRPASPPMVIAIPRRLRLEESRALTFSSSWSSWRLSWSPWRSSLLSSLSLPCLPRGFGWLDECADAANSARAIKLTRNSQKLYHVSLTCILERCGLAIMSSADVPPARGLRDISDSSVVMTLHDSSTATGGGTVLLAFGEAHTPEAPATHSHRPCRRSCSVLPRRRSRCSG